MFGFSPIAMFPIAFLPVFGPFMTSGDAADRTILVRETPSRSELVSASPSRTITVAPFGRRDTV